MLTSIAVLAALFSGQANGSASTYAQAERVINAVIVGNSRALNGVQFFDARGRAVSQAILLGYAKGCETDQIQNRGSKLTAVVLCPVKQLQGIRVQGGARKLEARPLTFVFGPSRKLIRVVLGDGDPLAPTVNIIPRGRR